MNAIGTSIKNAALVASIMARRSRHTVFMTFRLEHQLRPALDSYYRELARSSDLDRSIADRADKLSRLTATTLPTMARDLGIL
jgi:hypothetical protein